MLAVTRMSEIADPDKYFRITLSLAAVSREDYAAVHAALKAVRDKFCRGGSWVSVESVTPSTVVNR